MNFIHHLERDRHALASCFSFLAMNEIALCGRVSNIWLRVSFEPLLWRDSSLTLADIHITRVSKRVPVKCRRLFRSLVVATTSNLVNHWPPDFLASYSSVKKLSLGL